ncbi:MAG: dephospho-CoA kinase [Firmicutes bacterium]|nr:dephospho-CoA kinase [Bacillota bacterium]
MKVIGLTGGIASGKSTVANWFKEASIPVIDSDLVYKELSKPNEVLYNKIIDTFGKEILKSDLTINWPILSEKVFQNEADLEKLNQLTHPLIKHEIILKLQHFQSKSIKMVVVVVPLLFETDFVNLCNDTICVYVNRKTQIERLMKRDHIDFAFALKKINSQMPLEKKRDLADFVIDNFKEVTDSKNQFDQILKKLRSE